MTKLNEMWAALAAHQPQADAAGHGESWAAMCLSWLHAKQTAMKPSICARYWNQSSAPHLQLLEH